MSIDLKKRAMLKASVAAGLTSTLGLSLGLTGTANAAEIRPHIIRFGYGLADSSPSGDAVRYFGKEVERLSDGKIKVKSYGNGSLGSDEQMQSALIGGSQEMTFVSTAPLAGLVKAFGVFDLPFLFDNEKVADAVLDGPVGQQLLDTLPDKGLIGLLYWENGFRNLTNSRHAIEKMDDIKGIKLRVMQNEVALSVFNALGANAIPMQFTELFTALETKTVDGQENPLSTIQTSKFYEVQPYLTLSRHVYTPFVLLASKRWWDGLNDDERKVIEEAARNARSYQRKVSREADGKALAYIKDQGVTVSEFSPEATEEIRETLEPIMTKLRTSIGPDTVDGVMKAAKDAAS